MPIQLLTCACHFLHLDPNHHSKGVRTFVGTRSASNDFTLDDRTYDCSWNGGPSWSLAVDQHNKAVGDPGEWAPKV
jgi:hypothetical protein